METQGICLKTVLSFKFKSKYLFCISICIIIYIYNLSNYLHFVKGLTMSSVSRAETLFSHNAIEFLLCISQAKWQLKFPFLFFWVTYFLILLSYIISLSLHFSQSLLPSLLYSRPFTLQTNKQQKQPPRVINQKWHTYSETFNVCNKKETLKHCWWE